LWRKVRSAIEKEQPIVIVFSGLYASLIIDRIDSFVESGQVDENRLDKLNWFQMFRYGTNMPAMSAAIEVLLEYGYSMGSAQYELSGVKLTFQPPKSKNAGFDRTR